MQQVIPASPETIPLPPVRAPCIFQGDHMPHTWPVSPAYPSDQQASDQVGHTEVSPGIWLKCLERSAPPHPPGPPSPRGRADSWLGQIPPAPPPHPSVPQAKGHLDFLVMGANGFLSGSRVASLASGLVSEWSIVFPLGGVEGLVPEPGARPTTTGPGSAPLAPSRGD